MDIKRELKELLKQYATAQHNRDDILTFFPDNGLTSGNNNVYWSNSIIRFGITSLGNSNARAQTILPSDYVSGEDITFEIWYQAGAGDTIDYNVNFYYGNESTSLTSANNPSGQWTANAVAGRPTKDTLTITGTNITAEDVIRIHLSMDDNGAANLVALIKVRLLIPVNRRV